MATSSRFASANMASLAILILFPSLLFAQDKAPAKEAPAGDAKGAIIIASVAGDVKVQVNGKLDPDGKATGALLPQEEVKAGASIFDGHTVIVGKAKGSSAILLFSNGTVTTLKEDSQLNVRTFTQAKFESKPDQKISDLEEEPSSSKTDINLNFGDMVVDIKKPILPLCTNVKNVAKVDIRSKKQVLC